MKVPDSERAASIEHEDLLSVGVVERALRDVLLRDFEVSRYFRMLQRQTGEREVNRK